MRIYLCSRIAKDAHDLNNAVAGRLRAMGHEVFVPHEQHYNQIMNNQQHLVSDMDIYNEDMIAMEKADLCVIVGKVGVDCAFEIGWFEGKQRPILYYLPEYIKLDRHPMFYGVMTKSRVTNMAGLEKAVNQIEGWTEMANQGNSKW